MNTPEQGGKPNSFTVQIDANGCKPQPFPTLAEAQAAAIDASYIHRVCVNVSHDGNIIFTYRAGQVMYSKPANDGQLETMADRAQHPPPMSSFIRGECEDTPEFLRELRAASDRAADAGHGEAFRLFILAQMGV